MQINIRNLWNKVLICFVWMWICLCPYFFGNCYCGSSYFLYCCLKLRIRFDFYWTCNLIFLWFEICKERSRWAIKLNCRKLKLIWLDWNFLINFHICGHIGFHFFYSCLNIFDNFIRFCGWNWIIINCCRFFNCCTDNWI